MSVVTSFPIILSRKKLDFFSLMSFKSTTEAIRTIFGIGVKRDLSVEEGEFGSWSAEYDKPL